MRKLMLVAALAALAAGCAKSPESIAPAYVSDRIYNDLDCGQLAEEQRNLQSALSVASQQQSDARTNDIVGVVLLGLPVSTLSGGNVAYQVADLKGHLRAVEQSMVRKRCSSGKAQAAARDRGVPAAESYAHAAATPDFHARVAAAVETAGRPAGVRPLPSGPGIAEPVSYTSEEVLAYCRAGWETRRLTDGTVEYNPCYFQ